MWSPCCVGSRRSGITRSLPERSTQGPSAVTEGEKPMPPPEKIAKEFPKGDDQQLFRLETLHEFQCVRCRESKKSKTVAVQGDDWSRPLCNGCYGLAQSKKD